jgi:predicted alpha/beta-hydrolase family hydrolase
MKAGPFPIRLASGKVTAVAYPALPAPKAGGLTLLLAHGAGAGQKHPYMVGTALRLQQRGVTVVTFDFPYTENARKLPDKNDVLEGCFRAVFDFVRTQSPQTPPSPGGAGTTLFAGGKSMGGRIASQVAAKGEIDPAGLVFLGYPLHPPGKASQASQASQRRDKHLPQVRAPMLFVQGTRDAFGTPAEIAPLLHMLAKGSALFAVEGGDHSHAVTRSKKGAALQDDVLASIADAIVEWMASPAR